MRNTTFGKILAFVLTLLVMALLGPVATFAQLPTLRSNGKIAFTSTRDGNREIYVMNPDGSNQVRLTNNSGADDFPAWSPDGQRLACLSQNASGGYFIKLMNANGTGQTEITSVLFDGIFDSYTRPAWGMSWSPDGNKIAFTEGHQIHAINIDGSNRVNLTNALSFDSHPSWSPDGSRIVFSRSMVGTTDGFRFFTMNAIGSNQTELPGGFVLPNGRYIYDLDPAWSPDGTRVAGVQDWVLDHTELFIRTLSGTVDVSIEGDLSSPGWSPDGRKLVYSATNFQNASVDIFEINSDGSGLTQLTNTDSYEAHPSWQPLAASVSVSGRVTTPDGRGLRNTTVSLTDSPGVVRTVTTSSFGYYAFDNVRSGENYVVEVTSRSYRFASRTIQVNDNLVDVDFVGLE